MEIVKTHHIDASEPDANGWHDYYYEYDIYAFQRVRSAMSHDVIPMNPGRRIS